MDTDRREVGIILLHVILHAGNAFVADTATHRDHVQNGLSVAYANQTSVAAVIHILNHKAWPSVVLWPY
jgi:hypothetical protein